MALLWTAFLLGLVGSLHCAGMCGPLALALPAAGPNRMSFALGRVIYNCGRITTYCLIGVVFGLLGKGLVIAGLQRWISIAAGLAILCGLLVSSRYAINAPAWHTVSLLKNAFGSLIRRRTFFAQFLLGALNGLLPCGLVYVAAAGAVASNGFLNAILYMAAFGLGTIPMMLGIGLAHQGLKFVPRLRLQKLIPVSVVLVALLLVLRGMSLGIPYLSPELSPANSTHFACH